MLSISKMEALTRIGFGARGIMYLLIGYLALRTGRTEDGSGALAYLDSSAGKFLLALMALGFLAYALWRLSEALIDSEGHGTDAKGMAVRAGGAVSGLIHLGLSFTAASLALSQGSGGGGGSGAEQGAASALSFPGGGIALTLAALALLVTGFYQLVKAARADFLRHLDQEAARKSWVEWAGRAGYAARGIVFLIMGWFLWKAVQSSDASEAADMGTALDSLPSTLQMAVAAGLFLFGIFSLVEAVYRRINDPQVIDRLKAAAHRT
jgi:hypothetical protein